MAIIWDPRSMIPSTSSLLSTTIIIDHRACNSWATLRGIGPSPRPNYWCKSHTYQEQ
jgi:hypothetical protein